METARVRDADSGRFIVGLFRAIDPDEYFEVVITRTGTGVQSQTESGRIEQRTDGRASLQANTDDAGRPAMAGKVAMVSVKSAEYLAYQ